MMRLHGCVAVALIVFFGSPSTLAWGQNLAPTPPAPRWILIYAGGNHRPAYSVEELRHLITVVDSTGQSVGWLMTGAVFLEIRAGSGHGFASWAIHPAATGADWEAYLDSLLDVDGAIARLDSAVAESAARLGPPQKRFQVAVMIPYPDPLVGTMRYDDSVYRLALPDDRLALVTAFVQDLRTRFAGRRLRHLDLVGVYWLCESAVGNDRELLPRVAGVVHDAGLRFIWIPYYRAPGYESWKSLGFDEAFYQPNFFFHPGLSLLRVDSAMTAAERMGMNIELEFDSRIFNDSGFANHLMPYLVTLWLHPALRASAIAVYDGAGVLGQMATSRDPRIADEYRDLVSALTSP